MLEILFSFFSFEIKKIKLFARLLCHLNSTYTHALISSKNLKWQQLAFTSLVNFICFPIFNVYKYFITKCVCVFLVRLNVTTLTITIRPNLYTHTNVGSYVYLVIHITMLPFPVSACILFCGLPKQMHVCIDDIIHRVFFYVFVSFFLPFFTLSLSLSLLLFHSSVIKIVYYLQFLLSALNIPHFHFKVVQRRYCNKTCVV